MSGGASPVRYQSWKAASMAQCAALIFMGTVGSIENKKTLAGFLSLFFVKGFLLTDT